MGSWGVKKRRQADINDDVYDIEISFPTNINTHVKSTIERLLEAIIFERNDFDVTESLPMYLLDPATLSISADFTTTLSCFAIAEESVEPPPGSSLSKENTCSVLSPVGTY